MQTPKTQREETDPNIVDSWLVGHFATFLTQRQISFLNLVLGSSPERNRVFVEFRRSFRPLRTRGRPNKTGGLTPSDIAWLKAQMQKHGYKPRPTDRNAIALLQIGELILQSASKKGKPVPDSSDTPAAHRINAPDMRKERKTLQNKISRARNARK